MNTINEPMRYITFDVDGSLTPWYFRSDAEGTLARHVAANLAVKVVSDEAVLELPAEGVFNTGSAIEFRASVLRGLVFGPLEHKLAHQDLLDSMFQTRIIEIRNELRALGWEGDAYQPLSKKGADAIFKFKHAPGTRNVLGMNINGVDDDLVQTPAVIADRIDREAQQFLTLSRRVDVTVCTEDGCEGRFSVTPDEVSGTRLSPIIWSPSEPDAQTKETVLRVFRYSRNDGRYVVPGDVWRDLEDFDLDGQLWRDLLGGIAVARAVELAEARLVLYKDSPHIDVSAALADHGANLNLGQSEAFKVLLSDSKIRDSEGGPLLTFEVQGSDETRGHDGWFSDGILFTADPAAASQRALEQLELDTARYSVKVTSAFLDIRNPYVFNEKDEHSASNVQLMRELGIDEALIAGALRVNGVLPMLIRSALEVAGHDGLIAHTLSDGTEYVAFDSKQVLRLAEQFTAPPVQGEAGAVALAKKYSFASVSLADPYGKQKYVGQVIAETPTHWIQAVGRSAAVLHERDRFAAGIPAGTSVRASYAGGAGILEGRQQSRSATEAGR